MLKRLQVPPQCSADPPTAIVREMIPRADWSATKSPGHWFSPYSRLRSRYSKRFSKSNSFLPASTTMTERPGFSSESFCATIAAVMPPPMMTTSAS